MTGGRPRSILDERQQLTDGVVECIDECRQMEQAGSENLRGLGYGG